MVEMSSSVDLRVTFVRGLRGLPAAKSFLSKGLGRGTPWTPDTVKGAAGSGGDRRAANKLAGRRAFGPRRCRTPLPRDVR